MGRTLLCSLAGAGAGLLVGFAIAFAIIRITAGPQTPPDSGAVCVFVGVFLAGAGAIAGAIIGGVADLREFLTRKNQTPKEAQDRNQSG